MAATDFRQGAGPSVRFASAGACTIRNSKKISAVYISCISRGSRLSAKTGAEERAAPSKRGPPGRHAKPLPEVHFIGEIVGGTSFGSSPVCCKFAVEAGDRWEWLAGSQTGQSQTAHAESGSDVAVWAHPLDLHYVAGAMHGWPRLLVQVPRKGVPSGRAACPLVTTAASHSAGLGAGHLWQTRRGGVRHPPPARRPRCVRAAREERADSSPTPPPTHTHRTHTNAGSHELSCSTWRPVASSAQEFSAFFLGGHPSLKSTAVLGGGAGGASERFRLVTTAAGTVHVRVDVVVRHMEAYGVEW